MQLLKKYPQLKILKKLANEHKVEVHLVGGFLRDFVIGNTQNDFDFAVEKGAIALARSFANLIKGSYVLLDEENGCARVVRNEKDKMYTFDFADFRASTIEEDVKLRDFSLNTLTLPINTLKLSDSIRDCLVDHQRALKDIKAKRIKRTSIRAFRDDPLRMLRAFSLQASLGFRIELSTRNQIRKEADALRKVSVERIREEFWKILESERTYAVIKSMDQIGFLEKIIPQIHVMFDCEQGGFHHLDVWNHSLEALRQLEKILPKLQDDEELKSYLQEKITANHTRCGILKLGVLLHDIGKPETRKKEKNRYSFHGHENVGRKIVTVISKQLKFSTQERHILEDMVRWHLRPGYLSNFKNPSEKAYFRYFRDTKEEAVSIAILAMADQRATRGPLSTRTEEAHHRKICQSVIDRYFIKKKEKPFIRLIDGNDLIKHLKLKPSPLFKKILAQVEENQVLGKIKTKKQALALAKKALVQK